MDPDLVALDAVAELKKQLSTLSFQTDGIAETQSVALFLGGEELKGDAARADALKRALAGEVPQLEVKVTAYVQKPMRPNRKHVRVRPGSMGRMARSFVGMPVLKNHAHDDVDARAGTVTESELERVETSEGTEYRVRQTFRLVKQWAVVGVLDGTLDRLSVSWMRVGPVCCTVHGTPIFSKCYCLPGETDEKTGKTAEWEYDDAQGLESSFVNVPAVAWTSVDAVKQLAEGLDLAAHLGMLDKEDKPTTERTMDPKLLALITGLKLDANASPDDIAAALATLATERDNLRDQLAVANEAKKTAEAQVAELQSTLGIDLATKKQAHIDAKITELTKAGKLAPGGEAETALRSIGKRDQVLFDAQVKDLLAAPSVTPVGAPVIADPKTAPKLSETDELLNADPTTRAYLKRAGITKEQYEQHGKSIHQKVLSSRE